jgi:hypothetical protein
VDRVQPPLNPALTTYPLIHPDEILAFLSSRNQFSAPGFDGIPYALWLNCWNAVKTHVTLIFNACIQTGYHPSQFKTGKIIILRKPDKPTYDIPNSFCPITLLRTLSKLLEGVMSRRMQYFLESNNLLSDCQYGFRQHRSCEQELLDITENIRGSWTKSQVTSALYLDIQGAYDTVCHDKLLDYLHLLHCPTYILRWLVYFLYNLMAFFTWNVLGSDPAWALSDTKLSSEDLWLARRRAAGE